MFTAQPQPQVSAEGTTVTLSATATVSNGRTPQYQWQVSADSGENWSDIAGEQSESLTITSLSANLSGNLYRCTASSAGAVQVVSVAAMLTVQVIAISQQPTNQTASQGSATFSVTASVSPAGALEYQWQRSTDSGATWQNIAGATGSSLSLSSLGSQNNGEHYRVIASAGGGSLTSQAATLSSATITITQQPANQTAVSGEATFSVAATVSPSGTPTYQWQRSTEGGSSWVDIAGATNDDLSLQGLTSDDDEDQFRAIVFATGATTTASSSATLKTVAWIKVGSDIIPGSPGDESGSAIAVSRDGSTVVVGSPEGNPDYISVYSIGEDSWTAKGAAIQGGDLTRLGSSVAISDDGSVIAAASANDRVVRVFEWDGTAWQQRGAGITEAGGRTPDVKNISISGGGMTIAAVCYNSGLTPGVIRVFSWDGSAWTQKGGDISASDESLAMDVSVNASGSTIVVGEPYSSDAEGIVRVFDWGGSSWSQRGSNIVGGGIVVLFEFLGSSVDISSDGNTIVAGSGVTQTCVIKAFDWSGSSWEPRGSAIVDNEHDLEFYGVSMSGDGTSIAAGFRNQAESSYGGFAKVYRWDGASWSQRGLDIIGNDGDRAGRSVSINQDGTVLGIGAPQSGNEIGNGTGLARVYRWQEESGREWDVSYASLTDSLAFDAAGEILSTAFFFKPDGLRLYIGGSETATGNRVFHEYTLGDPWDISTAARTAVLYPQLQSGVEHFFIRDAGTSLYILNSSLSKVYEYAISQEWNISAVSFVREVSVSANAANPAGIFFKPDGSTMYILGRTGEAVSEYSLGSPWSLSSLSHVSSLSVESQASFPVGLFFRPDGLVMYTFDLGGESVLQYSLATPWSISSATYSSQKGLAGVSPRSLSFSGSGSKMFVLKTFNEAVQEYAIT